MSRKTRVVIICHFSNEEIRKKLPLSKLLIRNIIQKIRSAQLFGYKDFAIWNSILFEELEVYEDEFEFHVISPHMGLKKNLVELKINGIYYHIFKSDDDKLILMARNRIFKTSAKMRYNGNCRVVKSIISSISPDIINLIGSENPYYSMPLLGIKNIPIYLTCQTVYTNPARKEISGDLQEICWNTELELHKAIKYFGCAGRMHRDLILKNNPNATIFKHTFPVEKAEAIEEIEKKYDFVFYSVMLSQKKGVLDAIRALGVINKYRKGVTLLVIGACDKQMKKNIDEVIIQNDLSNNISFCKPFEKHKDLYEAIQGCRYAILPVKLDVISSSIIEAMLLGIPVVTYKTTGTPLLNKDKPCVLISDIGDIQGLADHMVKLLNNIDFANMIKNNAKEFVDKNYNNQNSVKKLIADYKAIIANYKYNTPIPEELLFDVNEFPKYEGL